MNCAIIGLPQSGKSTLFAAATGLAPAPGQMPQVRRAAVPVPDHRLKPLAKIFASKKITHANIEFTDFPGFSLADGHGRDQFRKYLPDIRSTDCLVVVVRAFENEGVPAYRDRINPSADLDEVWEELVFGDLETVTNRVEKLEAALKKPTKHDDEKRELAVLQRCQEALENERPISTVLDEITDAAGLLSNFPFLTEKPLIVVQNVSEDHAADTQPPASAHARAAVSLCAELEAEMARLDEADRAAFLADLGLEAPAQERLIGACYEAMGYISFLTGGPTEARAWSIPKGFTAMEAAGRIHTDLARGFIRAETVAYDDLLAVGDYKAAKAAGKVRQEPKNYVVQDGDVMLIKFNV
ncbi:MAG: redox-regulated ATPase YchF [Phycisphaerae bacterium]|nr:redox-regulated ATPase YchF [Phycisphaerae bacterium]